MNAPWNNGSKESPSALCMTTKRDSSKAAMLNRLNQNLWGAFEKLLKWKTLERVMLSFGFYSSVQWMHEVTPWSTVLLYKRLEVLCQMLLLFYFGCTFKPFIHNIYNTWMHLVIAFIQSNLLWIWGVHFISPLLSIPEVFLIRNLKTHIVKEYNNYNQVQLLINILYIYQYSQF